MKVFILVLFVISCSDESFDNTVGNPKEYEKTNLTTNTTINFTHPSAQISYKTVSSSYQIQANSSISNLTFTCENCAEGVSVNSESGLITWNLEQEGLSSSLIRIADRDSYIEFEFQIENVLSFDEYCSGNSLNSGANNLISWFNTHFSTTDCNEIKTRLQNTTKLTITGDSELSLQPLAEFVNLEILSVRNHHIESLIPIASLTNLEILDVRGNELRSLKGISSLTALKSLNATNNFLTSCRFLDSLTSLESLELGRNFISEMSDISSIENLEAIDLSYNLMASINALYLPSSLKEGLFHANRLVEIRNVGALRRLSTLDVSANRIISLTSLAQLKELEHLSVGANPLAETAFLRDLRGLKKLSLVGLFNLKSEDIEKLNKLSFLDLRLTRISCPKLAQLTCIVD